MSKGLPIEAMTKLLELKGAADDAQGLANSAQQKLIDLDRAAGGRNTPADDPLYVAERDRLTRQREKHSSRHREIANLVGNIDQWLAGRKNIAFDLGRVPIVRLGSGETVQEAVAKTRNELAALKANLTLVEHAPLPKADLIERLRRRIDALAQRSSPEVRFDQQTGEVTIVLPPEPGAMAPSLNRVIDALAWFDSDRLFERLKAQIEARPEPKLALTVDQKRARRAEINTQIDALERNEEALIMRAASDGIEILRRPNANPAAVLGITANRKAAAA